MLQWARTASSCRFADASTLLMYYLACTVVPVSVSRRHSTFTTERSPGSPRQCSGIPGRRVVYRYDFDITLSNRIRWHTD